MKNGYISALRQKMEKLMTEIRAGKAAGQGWRHVLEGGRAGWGAGQNMLIVFALNSHAN